MTDFSVYVIESNGDYYYSLKGQDFGPANEATIFRSEKSAQKMIRDAIELRTQYAARVKDSWPASADNARSLAARWIDAKIIKIA